MAGVSGIRIGTCSWAEKSLLASGEFYPKGICRAGHAMRNAVEMARLI